MAGWTTLQLIEGLVEDTLVASLGRGARRSGVRHLLPRGLTRRGLVLSQHIREGRFQRALALVAGGAGLLGGLEVTLQHYRGSYNQRIMWSPVVLSPALFATGIGAVYSRRVARGPLPVASLAMLADGLLGFAFHVRGVARKPGGWRIPVFNVSMGPPVFAPLLLGVGGFLGVVASLLRRDDDPWGGMAWLPRRRRGPRWLPRAARRPFVVLAQDAREGRLQQVLAGATAASAMLNGVEALYSHYKNAFRYRVEWTPIVLTPAITAAAVGAIASPRVARSYLPAVSAVAIAAGIVGFGFHVRGVARRPGGASHAVYNLAYGPPVLAPLLYAATGFLGLLASQLRRPHR